MKDKDKKDAAQSGGNRFVKIVSFAKEKGVSTDCFLSGLSLREDGLFYTNPEFGSKRLWAVKKELMVTLSFLTVENGLLVLEGHFGTCLPSSKVNLVAITESASISAENVPRPDLVKEGIEGDPVLRTGFKLVVPIGDFRLELKLCGKDYEPRLRMGKFFPVDNKPYSYCRIDGRSLSIKKNVFYIRKRTWSWYLKRELLFCSSSLFQEGGVGVGDVLLRAASEVFPKRNVWLISDRPYMAGDNGEALFSFLSKNSSLGVSPVFAVEKDSPDYKRLKKTGKVVPYWGFRHKLTLLTAEVNASSAADEFVINPFYSKRWFFRDLNNASFVFLQHGVIQNEMSAWLKRWNKNIRLFCCSAPRELDSIVGNPKYGYGRSQVKLTGLTRHDRLVNSGKVEPDSILIAPTWRKYVAGQTIDEESGKRNRNPDFTNTDYFRFYSRLINDSDICTEAENNGFRVRFLLHPALMSNLEDFSSAYCEVVTDYDYFEEFKRAAVMVTDYSSVAFDFAILHKPLIYAQFDRDDFFAGQWEKGYFDYFEDAFGPVCLRYEDVKTKLLSYIKNPLVEDEYSERVNRFFGPLDGRACQRVADEVLEMLRC